MTEKIFEQLREAGWPQHKCYDATCNRLHPDRPTLEELIDACLEKSENKDFHLEHLYDEWAASVCYIHNENNKKGTWHPDSWYCGATPVEAVAQLWLALNKK